MPSMHKLSKNNTTLTTRNGVNVLTLHSTEIVCHNPATGEIVLNSGGWRTATTKTRMNQYFNTRNLPISVFQDKGKWFVRAKGPVLPEYETRPFEDGMTVRVELDYDPVDSFA